MTQTAPRSPHPKADASPERCDSLLAYSQPRADYTELELVRDGICRCQAVISRTAGDKVKKAADDFCSLLERMTGARCPVRTDDEPLEGNLVLIGPSKLTEDMGIETPTGAFENERVILRRDGNRLALLGNDDNQFKGTQFAVTMLFERFGCGWFGPDPLWQVIPEKPTLTVGYLDINHTPAFISRYNNVLKFNPDIGERWYLGGIRRVAGHALTGLVPRDEYFPIHPEWFCELDGQRNPYVDWWQYCYSNEDLIHLFAQKIIEIFDADPSLDQYSIALNDGWYHGWCECEECRKMGTSSEVAVQFANRLAREVGKRYPHHKLTFLAYFPTYHPPRKPMTVEPNVEVMFCKEADMFMPVDKGPDNGYHQKYTFEKSKNTYPVPWKENFEKWNEMVSFPSIAIWDWYCIAAAQPVWKDVPWVQGDVITRNHRYWRDHGVRYIYNDQGPLDVFYEDDASFPLRWPLWYVNARGMWDKDLTGSEMLLDACKKLYGEAADLLFAYYAALADIAEHNTAKTIAWHPPEPRELYTPDAVQRLDRLMSQVRGMLPVVGEAEGRRLQVQLDLWDKAKDVIATGELID